MTNAVRTHFGRFRIDGRLYQGKASDDLSPDPGDRLHAAACIYGDVNVLLTHNLKDFGAPALAQAGDIHILNDPEHSRRSMCMHRPSSLTMA